MIKFEYDVIMTSQLVISQSILLFMVDFTPFKLCAKFQHRRFTNNRINAGGDPKTYTLTKDSSPNRV